MMKPFARSCLVLLLALSFGRVAWADLSGDDDDYVSSAWREQEVVFPAAPREENLRSFYVSAGTRNRAYVDTASLTVGGDGVVRYTLLVTTPEGGRNVSYEGMRCETREWRIYATGRSDGSWSRSRNEKWGRIPNVARNRYHAALFLDYFCPDGIVVRDVEEALDALQRGAKKNDWLD